MLQTWALLAALVCGRASFALPEQAPGPDGGGARDTLDSGGALPPEQAAYDVLHYDLALEVDPGKRSIHGALTVRAAVVAPLAVLVLDLDGRLAVESAEEDGAPRPFAHRDGRLTVELGRTVEPGAEVCVKVVYGGVPREAPRAPWDGGFTWKETKSGDPWIATTCQTIGADVFWPCKDHPSDEPQSMDLHITVPRPLVCASNGRLERVEEIDAKRWTFHWRVSTPINNYCVALNIAPYHTLREDYESVGGETFPVIFWVLPEDFAKGKKIFPEFLEHLRFFEETFGPYPFRADKYGVAQTPHLGMEHQTIIAYGNNFAPDPWKFDWLHHHELSHEWWGNLVSARDWSDFWIHEGFGTYAQALYTEKLQGKEAYLRRMQQNRGGISNRAPVAPRGVFSTKEMYSNDIYNKGAWVLHTLRYLIGDEPFGRALRRMAYPDPELEKKKDGSACRFATTDEFVEIAERCAGRELAWFFEVYLRQAELPELQVEKSGARTRLRWKTPGDLPFPMPVDVRVGSRVERVEVPWPDGATKSASGEIDVDPDGWVLKAGDGGRRGRR